ncbi:hypothetical protein C3L29_034935 [Pseudomonas sp. MWU12-2534b]|nr:hypothetical protein C3L29_034935 [Pseudomonas sp. MWU12-2534b]
MLGGQILPPIDLTIAKNSKKQKHQLFVLYALAYTRFEGRPNHAATRNEMPLTTLRIEHDRPMKAEMSVARSISMALSAVSASCCSRTPPRG